MAKKPTRTLRDGLIKASIWKNETQNNGTFYSVNFTNTYKDQDGNYHDTDNYTGSEMLRLSNLANNAYNEIAKLRAQEKAGE